MAKKKHGGGRKRGSRGFKGLGTLRTGSLGGTVWPGLIGLGVTIGGAIAIRSFVRPDPGAMAAVYRNAPVIGAGLGVVGAGVAYAATKAKGTALAVGGASILSGALVFGMEKLNAAQPGAMSAIANVPSSATLPAGTTAGLRALTMETRPPGTHGLSGSPFGAELTQPMNGVVMEKPMRGAVNPGAFGKPQSVMNG